MFITGLVDGGIKTLARFKYNDALKSNAKT